MNINPETLKIIWEVAKEKTIKQADEVWIEARHEAYIQAHQKFPLLSQSEYRKKEEEWAFKEIYPEFFYKKFREIWEKECEKILGEVLPASPLKPF